MHCNAHDSFLDDVDDQDGRDVGAECRRRGVDGAVDVEAGHPQLDRQVKLDSPLGGELSGDGGGDGPAVVAEADPKVGGVAGVDPMSGEHVAEPFDGGAPLLLAGAGDAGGAVVRVEAVGHRAVAGPTITVGGGAAGAVGSGTSGLAAAPVTPSSGWRR